jgi:uncharacterized coiled-coil protein SlyX
MAKLIKLLAVSAGSGFLLGAGIRAGAAMAGAVANSGVLSGAKAATDEPVARSGPREEALEQRLSSLEQRLSQAAFFEQGSEALEDRINRKITRLETDLAGQMSAITELRECSLRNEETVRRLLATLERLIGSELARTPGPVRTPQPLEPSAV